MPSRLVSTSLVAAALVACPAPASVRATVLFVPDGFGTIGAAIAAAVPGDTVRVSSAGTPYLERITLADGVVHEGGWNDDFSARDTDLYPTIIIPPGPALGTLVSCAAAGAATEFSGFVVQGGYDAALGGGMFCGDGTALLVRDCVFRGNFAGASGGAIAIGGTSAARIYGCRFEDNVATLRGGGISLAATAVGAVVDSCTFERCDAATGGQPTGGGGALFVAAPVRLRKNTIRDCSSGSYGGGILVRNADATLESHWITGAQAGRDGGGIYVDGGAGRIWGSAVDSCTADGDGGGIQFVGGAWRLEDSFIRDNRALGAAGYGGGLSFAASDNAIVRGTEISGNEAAQGGGVSIEGSALRRFTSVELWNNTLFGNSATLPNAGAAIHVFSEFLGPFVNNVIAFHDGWSIWCVGTLAQPNLRYNCVYNDDGFGVNTEYGGSCTDRTGVNGNISANPRLCDRARIPPDLALASNSPCLGTGEGGTDMGAHPGGVACGTVSIESETWGAIKARYR